MCHKGAGALQDDSLLKKASCYGVWVIQLQCNGGRGQQLSSSHGLDGTRCPRAAAAESCHCTAHTLMAYVLHAFTLALVPTVVNLVDTITFEPDVCLAQSCNSSAALKQKIVLYR